MCKKIILATFMDCHAASAARNDRKTPKKKANIPNTQAAGFCDDFGGFQGSGKGVTLSGNDRRHCRRIHQKRAKANAKRVENA